jgi:hypothetical protein
MEVMAHREDGSKKEEMAQAEERVKMDDRENGEEG